LTSVRRCQSRPLIERLFASWDEALPALRPSTKLAEAIGYALNRHAELMRFLDDGRIPLDTGHLERSIRPVAIGRRIFYSSEACEVARPRRRCTPSSKVPGSIIWT